MFLPAEAISLALDLQFAGLEIGIIAVPPVPYLGSVAGAEEMTTEGTRRLQGLLAAGVRRVAAVICRVAVVAFCKQVNISKYTNMTFVSYLFKLPVFVFSPSSACT